jgi:hypothetical protein
MLGKGSGGKHLGISLWSALDVPNCVWSYMTVVQMMMESPGLYGMDDQRAKLHEEIIAFYGVTREQSRQITDHMENIEHGAELHHEFVMLRKSLGLK